MKSKTTLNTKPFETAKVDEYMQKVTHPLTDVIEALRKIILSADK